MILILITSCAKKENKILLETEIVEHLLYNYSLTIYDDSTYSEIRLVETNNEIKNVFHSGKLRIQNDTLFFEDKIGFLKNNYVEIILDSIQMKANSRTESHKKELLKDYNYNERNTIKNGKTSYRLKIKQNKLEIPNYFDSNHFNQYHQFYSHFYDYYDFNEFQDYKRINLSNSEMIVLDESLKKLFLKEESLKKFKFEERFIQFIPIKTSGNEIYIIGLISCDEEKIKTTYISSFNDGGDCYIFFNLNLSTGKIEYRFT